MGWQETPSQYVILGSGKTATDAIIWLSAQGVDPDAICWVRPRDPWMLNRALIQPDPAIYLGMVADLMRAASTAESLPALFLALEEAGIMLRVDRSVTPTMAKAPTLGTWELDLLRTVDDVVRRGHVETVHRGRIDFADGSLGVADDALVVNCAADGLKLAPRVPIWGPAAITVQPVRAGFPCFGAALAGYVEATRDDDVEKNRLCAPSSFGNSLTDWARMNVLGMRNAASFGSEPDIRAWSDRVALQPRTHPAGVRRVPGAGRRVDAPAGPCRTGPGQARGAERPGACATHQGSVLLVHGMSSSRSTWWRVGPLLESRGWKVTTVDLAGHGGRPLGAVRSVVDLAQDVATRCPEDRTVVVGHSLGAIVALELVSLHPAYARGILLEDPPALHRDRASDDIAEEIGREVIRARADPHEAIGAILAGHPGWTRRDARTVLEGRLQTDPAWRPSRPGRSRGA